MTMWCQQALLVLVSIQTVVITAERRTRSAAFGQGVIIGTVTSKHVEEASGLAASRKHPGYLYTHNDHGGKPVIYVISVTGHLVAQLTIGGASSNDWEDIAIGRCIDSPDSDFCIYVGDTGNGGSGPVNNIYKIPEPDRIEDATINLHSSDILEFTWNHPDCETLMVDPEANVYIVSKATGGRGTIARLPNSAWGTHTRVALSSTAIISTRSSHQDPVAGDISPDGNEVLIKTHTEMFHWKMNGSRDYIASLQTPGVRVPYTTERQGEAVCWDATGNGYYTLSEREDQPLYHYFRG